jgi:hypothetical protein
MSAKFVEVRRADCLTLLVDGKRLLDPGARHNCRTEIEMVLQALIDADATSKTQHVLLVLTKLDKVRGESQETAQKTERNFEAFVVKIQGLFGRFFRGISSLKVAASPHSSVLPYGYGVADLLDIWTAPVAINEVADPVQQTRVRAMERFIEFE